MQVEPFIVTVVDPEYSKTSMGVGVFDILLFESFMLIGI